MKYLTSLLSFLLIITRLYAQDTDNISELIETQRFEFAAESADPLKGRTVFLSPGYTFTVTKDSVISDLPYYGRAYQATMNPSDAGIKFTSTKFDYTKKDRKNGGWELQVSPKDVRSSPRIFLTITASGSATVRINASDRQAISYSGRIKKIGAK